MQEKILKLDRQMRTAEGKVHEGKLELQQQCYSGVQKLLARKNDEIEELKSFYKTEQNVSEETIRKLEEKVQALVRELQVVRQAKEEQIVELKEMCEQSNYSLICDWEKRLHNAVAAMEKEEINIRREHTEDLHKLLENTTARLSKMEEDYLQQIKSANQTVKNLEARVWHLTVEAENSNLQCQKLSQGKTDAEQRYQAVCSELQEVKERHSSLLQDKDRIIHEYEENIQQLQSKYDVDINLIKQEHALKAAKASDVIKELQHNVSLLKQQLQDSEDQRQQQLKMEEVEADLTRSKTFQEQQSKEFFRQLEKRKQRYEQQIVCDTGNQIQKLREELIQVKAQQKQQLLELSHQWEEKKQRAAQDHAAAVNKLKAEAEKNMLDLKKVHAAEMATALNKIICEMWNQIQKLREELIQVNAQRKQQVLELSHQWEEKKQRAAQDHAAAVNKLKAEAEKNMLDLKKVHAAEMATALNKANSQLKQAEEEYGQKLAKSSQIIAELKTTISFLWEQKRRLQEMVQKLEDKQQQLIADNDRAIKITCIYQEYKATLKGMMPASLRQQYEYTIVSLKSQLNVLQKKVSVLQEELNACRASRGADRAVGFLWLPNGIL